MNFHQDCVILIKSAEWREEYEVNSDYDNTFNVAVEAKRRRDETCGGLLLRRIASSRI